MEKENQNCAECLRLSKFYAELNTRQASVIGEQADATRAGEVDKYRQLEETALQLGMERAKAKADIDKHRAEAHPKTSARQN